MMSSKARLFLIPKEEEHINAAPAQFSSAVTLPLSIKETLDLGQHRNQQCQERERECGAKAQWR